MPMTEAGYVHQARTRPPVCRATSTNIDSAAGRKTWSGLFQDESELLPQSLTHCSTFFTLRILTHSFLRHHSVTQILPIHALIGHECQRERSSSDLLTPSQYRHHEELEYPDSQTFISSYIRVAESRVEYVWRHVSIAMLLEKWTDVSEHQYLNELTVSVLVEAIYMLNSVLDIGS